MLLFYIDEFGDHSMRTADDSPARLKQGVSEWFILSAVGIQSSSRKPLAEAIFEIKERHFGPGIRVEPWAHSEIKGRYLFRASRSVATGHVLAKPTAFATLNTVDKVEALILDLGLVFARYRPLVFAAAVDKKRLLGKGKSEPPLGAAYAYLAQRVSLTMEKLHAGETAIMIADQQAQHESFFRSGDLNASRDRLTQNLPIQPNFNLVLDKPLWVDTDLSSWDREILQLADIVAYSVAEAVKRGSGPSESCYLWEQIRASMAIHWSTGKIAGGGLSIYPRTNEFPVST